MSAEEPVEQVEKVVEESKDDAPAADTTPVVQKPKLGGGGNTCTTCNKISFPAETVFFEQKPYHQQCFLCTTCNKKIQGVVDAGKYEDNLYCQRCFKTGGFAAKQREVKWQPKSGQQQALPSANKFGGGGTPCTSCQKTCYPAELVSYEQKPYHNTCLVCSECTTKCTVNTVNAFEDKLYCKQCWDKGGFRIKQRDVKWESKVGASGAQSAVAVKFGGGGTPCTSCQKTCYPAELVSYEQKPYHNACLVCSECTTKCTVNTVNAFEDKLYCKQCWDKGGFRIKQRDVKWEAKAPSEGSSGVAAKFGGGGTPCTSCTKSVYPAELVSYEQKPYHNACLVCSECTTKCTVNTVNAYEAKLYCPKCWDKGHFAAKQREVKWQPKADGEVAQMQGAFAKMGAGSAPKCCKCEKTVYPAETTSYEGQLYHIQCFRCNECNTKITPNTAEHKGPTPFCKKCWNEKEMWRA